MNDKDNQLQIMNTQIETNSNKWLNINVPQWKYNGKKKDIF